MANVLGELFADIAESIRGGLGDIGKMKPAAFPNWIHEIVAMIGSGEDSGGNGETGTSGELKFASGTFSVEADGDRAVVAHGLGCMPDFVIVQLPQIFSGEGATEDIVDKIPLVAAWGMKSSFEGDIRSGKVTSIYGLTSPLGIDNMSASGKKAGYISCPDEETFQVGATGDVNSKLYAGNHYTWFAVSGIGSGAADPVIEPLEITENGTYTAPKGVDGYSPVTVNVAGSGGGSLPAGVYWAQVNHIPPYNIANHFFGDDDKMYVCALTTTETYPAASAVRIIYEVTDGVYTPLTKAMYMSGAEAYFFWYNGKFHAIKSSNHYVVDPGTSKMTYLNGLPGSITVKRCAVVQNDILYAWVDAHGCLYQWDESTDSWADSGLANADSYTYATLVFFHNNELYRLYGGELFKYVNGLPVLVKTFEVPTGRNWFDTSLYMGGCIYYATRPGSYVHGVLELFKYDIDKDTIYELGPTPHVAVNTLLVAGGKVRIAGGAETPNQHLIMHEVTERTQ